MRVGLLVVALLGSGSASCARLFFKASIKLITLGGSVIARGCCRTRLCLCIDQLTQGVLIAVAKVCRVERAGSRFDDRLRDCNHFGVELLFARTANSAARTSSHRDSRVDLFKRYSPIFVRPEPDCGRGRERGSERQPPRPVPHSEWRPLARLD